MDMVIHARSTRLNDYFLFSCSFPFALARALVLMASLVLLAWMICKYLHISYRPGLKISTLRIHLDDIDVGGQVETKL